MKAKSQAKRNAILAAASQLFQEEGFERASISKLNERVGGSRATIYKHFPSKEALFMEAVFESLEDRARSLHGILGSGQKPIIEELSTFGEFLLQTVFAPEVIAARRMGIAEAGRSNVGKITYERGRGASEKAIAAHLQKAMDEGRLRRSDPDIASTHLFALLESELAEPFYHCVRQSVSAEEIRASVKRAVAVFMAAYGP